MVLRRDSVHKKSLFPSTASLCFPWGIFLVTGCLMLQEGWQVSPPGKGSATCIAKLRAIMPLIQAAWAHGGQNVPPECAEQFYLLVWPQHTRAPGGDAGGSCLPFPTAKHTNTINFRSCHFQLDAVSKLCGAIMKVFPPCAGPIMGCS